MSKNVITESRFLMSKEWGNKRFEQLEKLFEIEDGAVKKRIVDDDIVLIIYARNSLKPEISKILQS